ncbi:unnamed protein product [Closterium sp. NIES-53]
MQTVGLHQHLADSFTTPPRAVSSPLRTSYPLPGPAHVQVAVDSGAARGAAFGGAEPGGAESEGAETGGAEPGGVETGGAEPGGVGTEDSGGAEPQGAASSRGSAGALPRLSPQQLREWFVRYTRLRSGASGAGGARAADPGGTVRPRSFFVPLLQQVLGTPPSAALTPPLLCPPPDQSQPPLQPASLLPAPSPYTEQSGGLTMFREPASRPVPPVRTARRVPCSRPPPVLGTHAMTLHPSSVPLCVPMPAPLESSLFLRSVTLSLTMLVLPVPLSLSASACPPSVGGEFTLGTDVLEDGQDYFESLAAAVPRFASMLLAPEGDPDAPEIPTPRSYAEAIMGPYSSQWQAAMDAEMASWKSTGTYVDKVPPPGANIVDGMWIFGVKRPLGSPPAIKARYIARGFGQGQGVDYFQTFSPTPKMTTLRVLLHVAAQRDYELHSLDFSTAFLQGSLHEEIWLRRPPGFTGTFSAGTQWSLRQPVYGLCQAPHEWHDTLRTTLAALGFVPSTAYPSLFLRTDTSLPPFYVLVYVNDLVFATANTEALTLVKLELQKRHTCTDLGELRSYLGLHITRDRARCTITLTQSHMVHQVLQHFGF